MSQRSRRVVFVLPLVLPAGLCLFPDPLLAYGGPGSVVTGLGALLAVLAAVAAAVFGFVWYPVKRLLQKLRGDQGEAGDAGVVEEAAEGVSPE